MEGRAEHAIGQFLPGRPPLPHGLQAAAPRLRQHRIRGYVDLRLDGQRLRRRAALDDGLGQDGQADEGVHHHQGGEGYLRAQRGGARRKKPHRLEVREIDGRDVPEQNRREGGVPGKTRPDDADVGAVAGGSKQIPAETERVRRERHDVLPLHQQEGQVVGDMIADGDRDQREREALRDGQRRQPA